MEEEREKEIEIRLREILKTADLNTTSAAAVRRQLESELGVDLSSRKKFISQLIDDIIQHQQQDDHIDQGEPEPEPEEEDDASPQRLESPKKRKPSGFTRPCSLSPQLEEFFQVSELPRTEVVKRLWAYIRENNLQDPNNRRNIKCDPKLHSIFRVQTINMFHMNKVLSKHIWPLHSTHECSVSSPSPPEKKQKLHKEEDNSDAENPKRKAKTSGKQQKCPKEEDDTDEEKPKQKAKTSDKKQKCLKEEDDTDEEKLEKPKREAKQSKGGTSGFLAPQQLSEAFVKFLGTGETTLSRSEAVKRIWSYIKQNELQDPSDKRRILCDEKLKELFELDAFHGFSVTKYLTAHLIKAKK